VFVFDHFGKTKTIYLHAHPQRIYTLDWKMM